MRKLSSPRLCSCFILFFPELRMQLDYMIYFLQIYSNCFFPLYIPMPNPPKDIRHRYGPLPSISTKSPHFFFGFLLSSHYRNGIPVPHPHRMYHPKPKKSPDIAIIHHYQPLFIKINHYSSPLITTQNKEIFSKSPRWYIPPQIPISLQVSVPNISKNPPKSPGPGGSDPPGAASERHGRPALRLQRRGLRRAPGVAGAAGTAAAAGAAGDGDVAPPKNGWIFF